MYLKYLFLSFFMVCVVHGRPTDPESLPERNLTSSSPATTLPEHTSPTPTSPTTELTSSLNGSSIYSTISTTTKPVPSTLPSEPNRTTKQVLPSTSSSEPNTTSSPKPTSSPEGVSTNSIPPSITTPATSPYTTSISTSTSKPVTKPTPKVTFTTTSYEYLPSSTKIPVECNKNVGTIEIKKYGFIILVFLVVVMFLIIVILLFMIRNLKKKHVISQIIQPKLNGESTNPRYTKQDSTDSTAVTFKSNNPNHYSISRNNSEGLLLEDKASFEVRMPQQEASTRHPSVSKMLKNHQVALSREQMKNLCEAVLSKTSRAKEAASLSDLDSIVSEAKKQKKEKANKCVSTSNLETYDMLPSPRPVLKSEKIIERSEELDEIYEVPKEDAKKRINTEEDTTKQNGIQALKQDIIKQDSTTQDAKTDDEIYEKATVE